MFLKKNYFFLENISIVSKLTNLKGLETRRRRRLPYIIVDIPTPRLIGLSSEY